MNFKNLSEPTNFCNIILPMNDRINAPKFIVPKHKVLIIIHLYYKKTIKKYMEYIKNIPSNISIIFTISDTDIEQYIQNESFFIDNCKIIKKQNRGRDISAFLVACRKEILEYEYICFLHDKTEKHYIYKMDIENWNHSLWENMIGSAEYIDNILTEFMRNPKLGLLAPPAPIGEHLPVSFEKSWLKNHKNMKMLAEKMKLKCNINIDAAPNTLGTVFWARVSALKKLFEIEWSYEDFDPEPLKIDGTISHAIERIFPYVVYDAGYYTGIVMTGHYAGMRMEYIQTVLKDAFFRLKKSLGIQHISELYSYEEKTKALYSFCNNHKKIYIYGAGEYGKSCLIRIRNLGKHIDAFLVTALEQNKLHIDGIPVIEFSSNHLTPDTGIIIAINPLEQPNIIDSIKFKNRNFSNLYFYDGN